MAAITSAGRSLSTRSGGAFRIPLLALALVALAGFVADTYEVLSGPLPGFDVTLERAVQAASWGPLASVFGAIDWFEGLKQVAVAVLGVLAVAIWRRRSLLLMIWGAASGAVYQGLEMVIRRPRPDAHLVHVIRHTAGYGFPSGHVLFFTWFCAYLILIFARHRLPRPAVIAGWLAMGVVLAVVSIGRVYTAEHWPTDVLGGLLLGAAWTLGGLSIRRLSDPVLDV